jgi:hypothetical protein
VDPDGRYEIDIHYHLTKALSIAAEYPAEQPERIARANHGTDDDPATSPMGMSPFGASYEARRDYHFTPPARRQDTWHDAVTSGSDVALGRYLHIRQDSGSHASWGPRLGHGSLYLMGGWEYAKS